MLSLWNFKLLWMWFIFDVVQFEEFELRNYCGYFPLLVIFSVIRESWVYYKIKRIEKKFIENLKFRENEKNSRGIHDVLQKITEFNRKSRNVAKNHEILQKITKFRRKSQNFAENHEMSQKITKLCKKSWNFAENHKFLRKLWNFAKYKEVFKKLLKFNGYSQKIPKICKTFMGSWKFKSSRTSQYCKFGI